MIWSRDLIIPRFGWRRGGFEPGKKKTREKHLARTPNAWKTRNIGPSPPVAHGGGGGVGPKKI